jgi:hypothetical protein
MASCRDATVTVPARPPAKADETFIVSYYVLLNDLIEILKNWCHSLGSDVFKEMIED